jgi:hypothetical protein
MAFPPKPQNVCHVIKLEAGHALRAGKALKRKLTADVIKQGMTRGSFFRQPQAPARFKLGKGHATVVISSMLTTSVRSSWSVRG